MPSFNRPAALSECLASIEREVCGGFDHVVEVCILDDASTDPETIEIAAIFAERHPFAFLRRQPANVGIERNVLAAVDECHGEYAWLLGNDDAVVAGALAMIIGDLRTIGAPVHLYEKSRVTVDGQPRGVVPGSSPIDIPSGTGHEFPSLLDAAARQGFFSTFGFISQIVFRRAPFVAVDPSVFLDLTMYSQVFVMVEAFGRQPTYYRNASIALHRTASQAHKWVEALGRREEPFMAGGEPKHSRYFGTTLAAAWQRSIDRESIDTTRLATQSESLMTDLRLVDWIKHNRAIDAQTDDQLDPSVVADAERFVAAFDFRPIA